MVLTVTSYIMFWQLTKRIFNWKYYTTFPILSTLNAKNPRGMRGFVSCNASSEQTSEESVPAQLLFGCRIKNNFKPVELIKTDLTGLILVLKPIKFE